MTHTIPIATLQERFQLIDCETGYRRDDFAREVKAGLTARPKRLSCRFLYDREGSQLFEAICELPEYYLTRVERGILQERAGEIAETFPQKMTLVELGSGSAAKTRILIEELLRRNGALRFVPVDISRTMLEESSQALLQDYPGLSITAIAGEYHDALSHLAAENGGPKLILWLGSNIGNLDRSEAAAFLRLMRRAVSQQDRILIGIDLRKDPDTLRRAYDDSAGVTARFSHNILARINRDLGGHFDLDAFRHHVVYDEAAGRIGIYLVSAKTQKVSIDDLKLEVSFAEGERIHTENSYKYSTAEIAQLACIAGFRLERQWLDEERRFSVNLLAPDC